MKRPHHTAPNIVEAHEIPSRKLDSARTALATVWFAKKPDPEQVTAATVQYLNTLYTEQPYHLYGHIYPKHIARGIYEEGEKIAEAAGTAAHPVCMTDIEARFMSYMSDETTTVINAAGGSAIPRAISLTIMDQLDSM